MTGSGPDVAGEDRYAEERMVILQAMNALEDAYGAVFAAAHPGMTAAEIDAILSGRLQAHNAILPANRLHNTPCVIEEGGIPPKLRRDRVPLEVGKLWMMDNSVHVNGYWADLGRYAWFGSLPQSLARDYQGVIARQDQIAAAVRPWISMAEIMQVIPPGLGFEVHRIAQAPSMLPFCGNLMPSVIEQMQVSIQQGLVFEPGQVICIELWAGLAGGIEDMYRVENEGVVRISTLPRQIRQIPL